MLSVLKTSPQKTTPKLIRGRYILIVIAALILAILLYAALNVSDGIEDTNPEKQLSADSTGGSMIGVQPASFQQIGEFREGTAQRLRLSGKAEPGAVVVITNRGERLRQVRVNDLGQWGVTLDVNGGPMVLEAQLYMGEDTPGVRSEETVFRLPIPEPEPEIAEDPGGSSEKAPSEEITPVEIYKNTALIMVTAPGSPSRVIQSPFGGSPTAGPLSLSVIDYDFSGGVIITGTSTVPGRVRFYAQTAVIGETGIGVGGRWNFIASRLLPRAKINIRAELIPAPGAPNAPVDPVSVTVPFNFLPPLQEEDTDGSGALSINIDPQQWQVRRTLIGGGGQSTVIYAPLPTEANPQDVSETAE
ncbi:MAG: hypothetical protein ABJO36_04280 [Litorimonas sp.]